MSDDVELAHIGRTWDEIQPTHRNMYGFSQLALGESLDSPVNTLSQIEVFHGSPPFYLAHARPVRSFVVAIINEG